MTKPAVVVAAVMLAAAGCGANEPATSGRVERCVDRLLSRADSGVADEGDAREYARTTYCERFDANGWVYEDGALSIAVQRQIDEGGACGTQRPGEPAQTVPCEVLQRTDPVLECAFLHHVRRSEVRVYLERLDRLEEIRCDDGTPLEELGVP